MGQKRQEVFSWGFETEMEQKRPDKAEKCFPELLKQKMEQKCPEERFNDMEQK